MDTKKLAKIIKVIVDHEIKKKLPALIEIGVKKVLKESIQFPVAQQIQEIEEADPFSLANAMLDEDRLSSGQVENVVAPIKERRKLSKNSVLNDILNETKPFNSSQRINESMDTMAFGTNLAQGGTEALKSVAAGQMGRQPASSNTAPNNGNKISTGLPGLDRILNRDNSELVKRFKTRK